MSFKKAFEITIGHEGGYVFDPVDRGGETKYGITKRSYPHLDIKNLTLDLAENIYYSDFWNTSKMNLNNFDEDIAIELFDTGVNMGTHTARKMLQESLNILNRNETNFKDLLVDGWIGSETMKAVKKVNSKELLKTLNGFQFMRYYNIAINDPTQERFFAGWIKRT